MTRKALGRGLTSLIPEGEGALGQSIRLIEIDRVSVNPYQPRLTLGEVELEELSESLNKNGMLQPIVVTRANGGFTIIAGERRFRAAQRLKWRTVPAIVKDVSTPSELLELAIVENIQREDLDPIEEARAYRHLREEFSMSQDKIAKKVGKNRATVANLIRLLNLPEEIQKYIREGKLTEGHARSLLREGNRKKQIMMAEKMIREAWTVREAEKGVRGKKKRKRKPENPFLRDAEERLMQQFQTRVEIKNNGGKGTIRFYYHSEEELMRLFEFIMGGKHVKNRRT